MKRTDYQRMSAGVDAIEVQLDALQKQVAMLRAAIEEAALHDGATAQIPLPEEHT